MIYVTEVKYPGEDEFKPLMQGQHRVEHTCNEEQAKQQVDTMNDPKNKHYIGEYRYRAYIPDGSNVQLVNDSGSEIDGSAPNPEPTEGDSGQEEPDAA